MNQVRTTVYLDENLYITAKKKAIEERTTLTKLIQKGLQEQLSKKAKSDAKKRLFLSSYSLGLKEGVGDSFRRTDIYDDLKI